MKIRTSHIAMLLSKIGAMGLLLIFLTVPMLEALHSHPDAMECNANSTHVRKTSSHQYKDQIEKQIVKTAFKCKLCDLINHTDFQYNVPEHHNLVNFVPKVITLSTFYQAQHSSSFVLACANKGPPTFTQF